MNFNKLILLSLVALFSYSSVSAMDPVAYAQSKVSNDKLALFAGLVTTLTAYKLSSADTIKAIFKEKVPFSNPEFMKWLYFYYTPTATDFGSCPEEFGYNLVETNRSLNAYKAFKVVSSLVAGYTAYKAVKNIQKYLNEMQSLKDKNQQLNVKNQKLESESKVLNKRTQVLADLFLRERKIRSTIQ